MRDSTTNSAGPGGFGADVRSQAARRLSRPRWAETWLWRIHRCAHSLIPVKKWWLIGGAVVVVLLAGVLAGPWIYGKFIAEDSTPAASVSTQGAQAASGSVDGPWVVSAGEGANKTAAGYTVSEILNGARVTVVGTTDQVSGAVSISGQKMTAAELVVQVAGIATDNSHRDGQFRSNVMDTAAYPTAKFTLAAPVDLASLPTDGTAATVPVTGTLTLKDQTRPVSVDVKVLHSGDTLVASGNVPVTWSDYGITPPSLGFVTVDDHGTVDILVSLAHA
ncbi:polyisoprenoid-binding protein YceI [Prescottella agglutinans]|uniref:Polyisoprenoid-binding protein YceI n=1 Tax=Prescottella agglutinans TaxID=1644129 RepID=A0ABT6MF53_9NOCA|nr:polyisoprenoid-binding protein YceI [Prescottella agglutinans]